MGVHKDQDIMKMALLSDVYMLYLPAGTTQWSQPLDNLLFAHLKQEVKKESQSLIFTEFLTDEVVFSFVDIVLHATKRAFTLQTVASSFKEMGLHPFDELKFLELARINHDPSIPWVGPTKRDEFLIQEVVAGLQTYLSSVKKSREEKAKELKTIEVSVKKNFLYRADELIVQGEKEKVEKEKRLKEKELEKEKKENERKQKREEEERKKQEREALCAERKVKKAKLLKEREEKREENTCKGGCGRVA